MKLSMHVLAVCALLAVGRASSVKAAGTPIGQVVQMLQGMLVKGKAAKTAEKVGFAKFSVYCGTTRTQTTNAISTGADNIVQQKADIGKALSDAEVLAEEIKDEQADVEKNEKEQTEATAMRKKERTDYTATHKDFSESIEAIGKANKVIQAKNKDVPQSLLQVQQSKLIPAETKATITSLIALGDSIEVEGPPKANAYEGQSSGIVGILEKLKLKFEDQKTTLEKEEASTKAAFELLNQKLTDSIRNGKATVTDKTAAKAKRLSAAADSKGDLDVTTEGKGSDELTLSDLNTECDAKSREYDKNQVTRADEIKAMETAVKILGSDTVAGAADKHKVLLDTTAPSLAQLRAQSGSEYTDKRRNLVTFLQGRASKLGSKYLALVASRALTDPFGKVKKMIKDLIVKLLEEANAEADQKGYCDSELGTNKQTRDAKSSEVDELTANIEKLTANSVQMAQDMSTLSEQMGDLRKEMATQTELRNEEKSENTNTINEAKSAQVAVERATQVMQEFYAQAKSSSASMLQTEEDDSIGDDMAQLNAAPYQGMQASSGGIIGMLATILTDFATLESTTSSAEDTASTTYDKFMQDSTLDSEVKGVENNHLEKKAQTTEETIRSQKKELKATQDELDAALDYYEKLRPDCVDTGLSYQDRVEMRQAEIQSLQEAMKTLSEE